MFLAPERAPKVQYDWASHPIWYNVLHPWHWLTYGNNGTAAATAAVLIYTYLTYQMARTSQDALKSAFRPMLAISKAEEPYTFRVQNIGSGPATGVRVKVLHIENPSGPTNGSWFRGISPVTPIASIKGVPLGKEACCEFSVPEQFRRVEFAIVTTCWDMTRIFQQSMVSFSKHAEWTDREIEGSMFSRAGILKVLLSSMYPTEERRTVYWFFPGLQGLYFGIAYIFYFRGKFLRWKESLTN
jgi:hypothetical protein